MEISKAAYVAAIPGCCRLRTYEEHAEELMLCWGIISQLKHNSPDTPCGICEFNVEPAGDFARIEWLAQQEKKRMWDTLKGTPNEYFFLQQSE